MTRRAVLRMPCCGGKRWHTDDCEHGPTLDETMARLRLRPQSREQIAATVATLAPGQLVRITEDAPGWPLCEVVGRVVEGPSGTLTLDSWPWPLRLPSGEPGPAVVRIEVLPC